MKKWTRIGKSITDRPCSLLRSGRYNARSRVSRAGCDKPRTCQVNQLKAFFSHCTPTERKFQILCPTRILFLMILATLSWISTKLGASFKQVWWTTQHAGKDGNSFTHHCMYENNLNPFQMFYNLLLDVFHSLLVNSQCHLMLGLENWRWMDIAVQQDVTPVIN